MTELTKLTTSKINTFFDSPENDAEITKLVTEIAEIRKQLTPLYAEDIVILEKLKNWLTISKQRPDNYNQQHPSA